jgi:hypothetical protein
MLLLVYLIGFGVPALTQETTEAGSQPLGWLPTDPVILGGFALALWQDSIWYGRKWSTTLKNTLDGAIYAILTAGSFGWLWPGA